MDEVNDAARSGRSRRRSAAGGREWRAAQLAVAEAITGLPERERLVMSMYYDDELNLKEIGAVLGISESRVCQLHGQALVRLRARLRTWNARAHGVSRGSAEHHRHRAGLRRAARRRDPEGRRSAFAGFCCGADDRRRRHLRRHPDPDAGRRHEARLPASSPGYSGRRCRMRAAIVPRMVEWSQIARKQGLLGLEAQHAT